MRVCFTYFLLLLRLVRIVLQNVCGPSFGHGSVSDSLKDNKRLWNLQRGKPNDWHMNWVNLGCIV